MAITNKNKKIMEKKLLSLQKQVLVLRNKLFPNKYSWRAFTHNDEPYIQFGNDMVYPLTLVSSIVKTLKKDILETGTQTVGLVLELPSNLFKKGEAREIFTKRTKTSSTPLKTSKNTHSKQTLKKKVMRKR